MAHNIPDYLFRVWSEQSNGINAKTLFIPVAFTEQDGTEVTERTPESVDNFADHLRAALPGRHRPNNQFLFATYSFLYALQVASWKKAQGETNVYITCFNTKTTKTRQGRQARFHSVKALLSYFKVEFRNSSDNSLREYPDEYVAMSPVVVGHGSCMVGFDTPVKNGLYDLHPELGEANKRRNPRWYLTLFDLRQYGFEEEQQLTKEKIDVAARLAFCFVDCVATKGSEFATHSDLLAWLLTLRKRSKNDQALQQWLQLHSNQKPSSSAEKPGLRTTVIGIPEFSQYCVLVRLSKGKSVNQESLRSTSSMNAATVNREISSWHTWRRQAVDERRQNGTTGNRRRHTQRAKYRHRRYRDDRSRSPRRRRLIDGRSNGWRDRR